jgi:hypothetical protein
MDILTVFPREKSEQDIANGNKSIIPSTVTSSATCIRAP